MPAIDEPEPLVEPEPCGTCGGMKWVQKNPAAHPGEPGFGMAKPCPTCQAPDMERRIIERSLRDASIPQHFYGHTFESYRRLPHADVDACDWVEEWVDEKLHNEQDVCSLLLIGSIGAGKTGVGISGFRRMMADGGIRWRLALFVRTIDLFEELGEAIDLSKAGGTPARSAAQIIHSVCEVPLLFLDDVAAERWTGYREEKLYQIIGYRHDHQLTTIFTSNKGLDELRDHLGARTHSRLIEMCKGAIIEFTIPKDIDLRLNP